MVDPNCRDYFKAMIAITFMTWWMFRVWKFCRWAEEESNKQRKGE